MRALTDDSEGLASSAALAGKVVDAFGESARGPERLKAGVRAGAHAAASLGTAALSVLPPAAVGALPQLLGSFASKAYRRRVGNSKRRRPFWLIRAAPDGGRRPRSNAGDASSNERDVKHRSGALEDIAEYGLQKALAKLPPSEIPAPPGAPAAAAPEAPADAPAEAPPGPK